MLQLGIANSFFWSNSALATMRYKLLSLSQFPAHCRYDAVQAFEPITVLGAFTAFYDAARFALKNDKASGN